MSIENRRRRRVTASHRIAAAAFRLAAVFGVVAVAWAVRTVLVGGTWWGPVHSVLLGTVTLAIAGAAQMFTITWSAAPSPPAWMAASQRWVHAIGAGAVLVGFTLRLTGWVVVGGVGVGVGLGLLGFSLLHSIRHSLLRRFDLSARFYLLGLGCGVVGVTLGVWMAAGMAGSRYPDLRLVHGHLNLVGFVGFTIIGTLPTLLPTFARHRAVSGVEAVAAWWLAVVAAGAIMAGLVAGPRAVAAGSLLAGASLAAITSGVVVRLGRTGFRGGLPYLQVTMGCAWLVAWALVDGVRLLVDSPGPAFGRWILVAVVGGVLQVLLGALAYLVPVLVGSSSDLGRNLDRLKSQPWIPLAAANVAAIGLVAGAPAVVTVAAMAVWLADFARRLVGVMRRRRDGS